MVWFFKKKQKKQEISKEDLEKEKISKEDLEKEDMEDIISNIFDSSPATRNEYKKYRKKYRTIEFGYE